MSELGGKCPSSPKKNGTHHYEPVKMSGPGGQGPKKTAGYQCKYCGKAAGRYDFK